MDDKIKEVRKAIKHELFRTISESFVGTHATMPELRGKPLSKEDFDRFKEEWNKAMNDPQDPPKIIKSR